MLALNVVLLNCSAYSPKSLRVGIRLTAPVPTNFSALLVKASRLALNCAVAFAHNLHAPLPPLVPARHRCRALVRLGLPALPRPTHI
ncbi:hypothetical protein CVT26_006319 [Gymnopilus dilepis]|uniref:Uncharacterized protein n=1 Tax=Gymnopilus dilepis TaxID=231916 RepID=A0A409W661_9AGAR|nr:hypothetical protein CVT26_006319 [Gymnopilus dilepis]